MHRSDSQHELPKNIDRYLATLSKLYEKEGLISLQELIVNSQIRVHEGWSQDNWNGGTYGHALYLILPEELYLNIIKQKDDLRNKIKEDINKIHNIQNEFIEEVFFEFNSSKLKDWRKDSGLLLVKKQNLPPNIEKRIWGNRGYRLFLSHTHENKITASDLKKQLEIFGISCFVAHIDIHPTQEWQNEIKNALLSMDAFIALLTDDFHSSYWTDQEVGFAFARNVPIVCLKMGIDPYGFIGKFQALTYSPESALQEIVKIFIQNDRMLNEYITAIQHCNCYDDGNALSEILPFLQKLSRQQVTNLIHAFENNNQIRDCFGFNGKSPYKYGDGLASHLSRITGRNYTYSKTGNTILLNRK
ncbi:MAG: toll/interleukin-1 receptor domain-containing protein [bacterium]